MMGIPLPDATQFELVESVADVGYRIYEYMKHCAADSQLAYHDDTTARILSMIKENQQSTPKRKAMYTTAMVFEGEHPICLFVTGRQHAGENLAETGDISRATAKGIHVTTRRQLHILKNKAILIDMPGLREIGIADAEEGLKKTFTRIIQLAEECRFDDCTHTREPDCAVKKAVDDKILDARQYENYINLRQEYEYYIRQVAEKAWKTTRK